MEPEKPGIGYTTAAAPVSLETWAQRSLELVCASLENWSLAGGIRLRRYQLAAGEAICRSALSGLGGSFAVMFPRQSGKNELQAWIESYLLFLRSVAGAEMVKISPTWKPQSLNAMNRLERVLNMHPLTRRSWRREAGYQYLVGNARISFFSGQRESNIVGATASLMIQVDEAQDVEISKYDKDVGPMAAATNAVRVFWGTAWSDRTLLSREMQPVQDQSIRRVWQIDSELVRQEVEAYGVYVDEQVRKLGRDHPLIRTQYFSENLSQDAGLFTTNRRMLMQGMHAWLDQPIPGENYALLVDVGGSFPTGAYPQGEIDEPVGLERDATAVTIVRVSLPEVETGLVYEVVHRLSWIGEPHPEVYARLKALAETWGARAIVVDATGMGESLAGFLERGLPGRIIRFVFSAKSKSDLAWAWLSAIETNRYKEYLPLTGSQAFIMSAEFWRQADHCEAQPASTGFLLRWGVPDGRRDEKGLVHDDLLTSAALCTVLERITWGWAESVVIPPNYGEPGWGRY